MLLDYSLFTGPGIALAVLAGILVIISVIAVARSQRRTPSAGRETLIGRTATARTALQPEGTVYLDGELWKAFADGPHLDAGTRVVITNTEGLTLTVRKKEE